MVGHAIQGRSVMSNLRRGTLTMFELAALWAAYAWTIYATWSTLT